jgi:hypothetical protein
VSTQAVRRCDNPTCRVEIPPTAKVWEFRAILALHNGGTKQAELRREACGHACLMASMSDLIKATEAATPMGEKIATVREPEERIA